MQLPKNGFKKGSLNNNWVTKVEYAPTIINSPWARFITPMSPKTIARPRAAIRYTDPNEIPLNSMSTISSTKVNLRN